MSTSKRSEGRMLNCDDQIEMRKSRERAEERKKAARRSKQLQKLKNEIKVE